MTRAKDAVGRALAADAALTGLVTFAPDDLDWDDEVRVALRRAREPVAGCADRHGSESALRRPGDDGDEDFRPAFRLAELDLHPAQRGRRSAARSRLYGTGNKPRFDWDRV